MNKKTAVTAVVRLSLKTGFTRVFKANTGRSDGFNQSYFIWNASFARQVLKNKRGEVKLSVYDILNQNQSVTWNIGENYVEDVQKVSYQKSAIRCEKIYRNL